MAEPSDRSASRGYARARRRRPPLRRAGRARRRHHVGRGRRAARRARLQRRRQDDAVQRHHRRLPADRAARSASSARTSPTSRPTSASAAVCGAPTRSRSCSAASPCIDSVFLACRGVSRQRYLAAAAAPRRRDHGAGGRASCMPSSSSGCATRRVAELSHGQQRQLEIALAFAGAPRFILFDEPAAGLSPTERRDLVDILTLAAGAYRLRHHRARPRRGARASPSV